jgi:hypothetical protein
MVAHSIRKNKRTFLIGLVVISVLPGYAHEGTYGPEIVRGFYESASFIRTDRPPSQWCSEFKAFIKSHDDAKPAFVLGASFGFSFRSESIAEAAGASQVELRQVAAYAAVSRLRYETIKTSLKLTDADIVTLLGIRTAKFAAWKARATTADPDGSVTRAARGIDL